MRSWTIVQSSQSAASNIECNLVQQYCRRYANRNVLDSITREFPGPTAEDAASVQYANSNEMFCCRDFRFATYPSSQDILSTPAALDCGGICHNELQAMHRACRRSVVQTVEGYIEPQV